MLFCSLKPLYTKPLKLLSFLVVGHEESVETLGFSKHLPLAASAGVDGRLLVWDLNTLSQRSAPCVHPEAVTRMCWHPLQPLVVTACMDGAVRCWDLRTGSVAKQFGGHSAGLLDVALSPDGSMIISAGDDHTARIFSLEL
jgi:ribosome assembly protein SQT1